MNIIMLLWWSLRRGNRVVPSRWQATAALSSSAVQYNSGTALLLRLAMHPSDLRQPPNNFRSSPLSGHDRKSVRGLSGSDGASLRYRRRPYKAVRPTLLAAE